MPTGTVKWFNPAKGYGFIQPQGGGKDVFVHISAVERAGLSSLNEGQAVEFEIVSNRGKTSAENLRCLVPDFDGASSSHDSKEALWDKFYTAAPPRRRQSVEQYKIVKRA
jgi:CspA family cold shock protein